MTESKRKISNLTRKKPMKMVDAEWDAWCRWYGPLGNEMSASQAHMHGFKAGVRWAKRALRAERKERHK